MLDDKTVRDIAKLNTKLKKVEKRVYALAKKEHQKVLKRVLEKEDGIVDYELHVNMVFYSKEEEITAYEEYFKPNFLLDRSSNFNDNQNHNVSSALYPHLVLNAQKHCWLLHHLYDDVMLSWQQILSVDEIAIDIDV
ncbi:MAG: hypothetical protein IBX44_00065 [Sulfurospirillum sp.]|nr:hypothetical protein [Sulfurospirillum sp.]